LKHVVIATIEQRDLHVGLSQGLRGRKSAEATANNHDMRVVMIGGH
jgi:hypothetical protein